jgi:hypothetical protein
MTYSTMDEEPSPAGAATTGLNAVQPDVGPGAMAFIAFEE